MVFSFAFSSVGQAQALENDNKRITNALEDTLAYENDAYIFDRERAIENGLTVEEANILEESISENTDRAGALLLPFLAIPPAVAAVAKAAAGGAAGVAGAFMLDVYNTSTYTACQNFYGQNGVIDNFCEATGHID